ncbi:hypothetical protein ASG87_17300 [Frateuria sp. Soil773]|uniref:LuxR C-terminal-related transcriptional regulator n=1 Tax=Frateuria sp. Soil773 TaxID=1736407 RepID=UPI0006F7B2BE|nr:LuxR C-terminal-related transcriptional regulator [Frateuria sp. Soil773]KRE95032.1 hypothetical protein ASG87_17300 [Frateuria sp. Soil773]
MQLTKREQDVLALTGLGMRCEDIADRLGISVYTVRKHRSNLQEKLGRHGTAQLVAHAVKASRIAPLPQADARGVATLSRREHEILELVAAGLTCKEAARQLGISPATARKHRERLMRKLDAHHVADLARAVQALRQERPPAIR